jgi:hypothetical protein
LRRENTVIGIT